jgi:alpha-glucosidase (family GH31 glycosyl hydrolase)
MSVSKAVPILLAGLLAVTCATTAAEDNQPVGSVFYNMNPQANPKAIVQSEDVRFTVLTPAMVRMEWSPEAAFVDQASQVFLNRRLDVPEFSVERDGGWLTIRTAELELKYKEGSGKFTAENLTIRGLRPATQFGWHPWMENEGNLQGTTRTLDGVSGSCPLEPGLLSRSGWSLVDDSRTLLFTEEKRPWLMPRAEGEAQDWYFFGYGHDYTRQLQDYTLVAGHIPLPPRYLFGSWWSRYWAYSDAELRQLVKDFNEHDVPLDVLVVDMDWHLDGWTGYTWNTDLFPDPTGFLKWVDAQGLRTTLNLHPHSGVGKHEAQFEEFARAMGKDPAKVNNIPFKAADRQYMDAYFELLHHPYEKEGVDFWWIDWQQGEKTALPGLDPLWWLNHLHWEDMAYSKHRGDLRPLIFSRWGGLGNHRYQIGFSGDTYCNWPSLAFQPYFTATAGNVGFSYWSHDIGGHQPGAVEPELYTRWIQFGALSPALRTHTTKNPDAERRIWKFPRPYFEASREAFHLRYSLIPYIYTAARKCYDEAIPMCRPLYYHWPERDEAYDNPNEYMFGDDMLVAPVVTPAGGLSGLAETPVWLPPGEWVHWFTGRQYTGPAQVVVQSDLNEFPLFVRVGALIPTQSRMLRSDAKPIDPLIVHVWPGADGRSLLYEDDGLSNGYEKEAFAWTPMSIRTDEAGVSEILIGPAEGSFKGMPEKRTYEIHLRDVWPAGEILANGKSLLHVESITDVDTNGWSYDSRTLSTVIRVPSVAAGEKLALQVKPHPDYADAPNLREGFRGSLARVADIGDLLLAGLAGNQQALEEPLMAMVQTIRTKPYDEYPGTIPELISGNARVFVDMLANMDLTSPTVRRAAARLFGLSAKAKLAGTEEGKVTWRNVLQFAPVAESVKPTGATLKLAAGQGWNVRGAARWSWTTIPLDKAIEVETTLVPESGPQTVVLRSDMEIKTASSSFVLPFEQVMLPSINQWWIVGPFDAPNDDRLRTKFGPETDGFKPDATYKGQEGKTIAWQKAERQLDDDTDWFDEYYVEFHKFFGGRKYNTVAYGATYLEAREETPVQFALGSDDGFVLWLNGEEIARVDIGRPYKSREDIVKATLKKGVNTLMIKVSQGGGMWGFGVHVENPDGTPATTVKTMLKKPE